MRLNGEMIKKILLFIVVAVVDFLIIQAVEMVTPRIIWFRITFMFLVFSVSIWVYYCLIKPANVFKTGFMLSCAAFLTAFSESLFMHMVVKKDGYQPLFLTPGILALLLPIGVAWIYRLTSGKKMP